jgi:hypothetical protein
MSVSIRGWVNSRVSAPRGSNRKRRPSADGSGVRGERWTSTGCVRHRKIGTFTIPYRPGRSRHVEVIGRVCATCARSSNAAPCCTMWWSASWSRTPALAIACGRVWFMYWVVVSRSNDSYTRAGHPVTSRASASITAAVPLRRR